MITTNRVGVSGTPCRVHWGVRSGPAGRYVTERSAHPVGDRDGPGHCRRTDAWAVLPIDRGERLSCGMQRLPGPALMVVNKAVGFRLLTQVGKRSLTRLGKAIALAGGVIGAGLDGFLMRSVAKQARQEFPAKV